MTGKTIGLQMNFGFKGMESRGGLQSVKFARPVKANSANIPFGMPVVQNTDNTYSSPETVVLTTANFGGWALAEAKQNNSYPVNNNAPTQIDAAGFYRPLDLLDAMKVGNMTNICVHGTPGAGTQVYVRTVLNDAFPAEVIGDIRADADSSNTIAVPNCIFTTGLVDPNGIVEISTTKQNI